MADIGKAYLQIIPKAEGISGQLGQMIDAPAKAAGEKGGSAAGAGLAGGIKKALAGLAIGATVTAGFKAAIDEGAKLQQSFGGLDTLYGNVEESAAAAGMSTKEYLEVHGNAADKMKQFAQQAAAVGISANDYAEQAVSFGASLKQAFGGDASKAAEAANTAILDMTDNAAKMGTPIENIQNAYQGFAKGNYTMLDNLKLGYGGTKTEMERLLADAQKISGVEYNMDNLGDVYEAIHVIQGDLGLTGVAAEEAAGTFSGSFAAMQASAANLLAALSTGGDVSGAMSTLLTSASTFFFNNFLPMVGQIVSALPGAIQTALTTAAPILAEKVPALIQTIADLVTTNAPGLIQKGLELVQNLATGFFNALPEMQAKGLAMLDTIFNVITTNLPTILEKGKNILLSIATGILNAIPQLITTAGTMVQKFIAFLTANLPTIGAKGGEFLQSMATKIISSIPSIISAVAKLIPKIAKALVKLVPVALKAAVNMIKSLVKGIKNGFSNISPAITQLVEKIRKPIDDLKGKLETIMNNIMTALGKVWDDIKTKASTAWEAVKKAITDPIDKAKSLVDTAVSKIKGLFPISMGKIFSGVKLPHFKISGGQVPWGVGGMGTKPSVSIEWYKRGGIAKNPVVYGIGEAGNEAIVPLSNPYMKPFAKAIAREMPRTGNVYNITVSGAGDPKAVVNELLRRVEMKARTA